MAHFYQDLLENLKANRKVVIARIIRQEGSAPRTTGARCLILQDGSLTGTIGGGILEYQVLEAARDVFSKDESVMLRFEFDGQVLTGSDMLCGGRAEIYLEPVAPENSAAREVFQAAALAAEKGPPGILATRIAAGIDSKNSTCRAFVSGDGAARGTLGGDWDPVENLQERCQEPEPFLMEADAAAPLIFAEPVKPDDMLYIFGAGHVSTFIAPLAKTVGFRVIVIDDRAEFANKERFPSADEIRVGPFIAACNDLIEALSTFIVIVTRGHQHDADVLRCAIQKSVGYIGMIGSRRKRDTVYQALLQEGVSKERLAEVCCPIGLEIASETPEEIAVSIVAELIQKRAVLREMQKRS